MPYAGPSLSVPIHSPREGSVLRPESDPEDVRQLGKHMAAMQRQNRDVAQSVNSLKRVVEIIRRRILGGGGAGGVGGSFRGEYDPTASYAVQDIVVIRAGSNAGSFVCVTANNSQAPQMPDTGNLYWVSLSGNVPGGGNWISN